MSEQILIMTEITKAFSGVNALCGVDFSCNKGEVHCLAGENGAGKSTLLKILAGLFPPDRGSITLNGEAVSFRNPRDAQTKGIAMVYQELTLIPEMSVSENIFLNIEPKTRLGMVDKKRMHTQLIHLMDQYTIQLDPNVAVKKLSVAQQQMTEILKLLVHNPEVIVLDEPTSSLARQEVEKLYQIIRAMTEKGKTIIFISHRMEEMFAISDRITVLKDGELVGSHNTKDIDEETLVKMMVGRPLQSIFPPSNPIDFTDSVFALEHISVGDTVNDISFEIKRGEVVGIAGLAGHGQTELLNAIAGILPKSRGRILLGGKEVNASNPWRAIRAGIALVPSDRKTEGLLLSLSVQKNLSIANLKRIQRFVFINRNSENKFVSNTISRLSIKLASPDMLVQSLSGGNQQKVVLGKELAIEPKVILFNEPTRGIDIEAKSEFYSIMRKLAANGVAVLICSSDLLEIAGMSDRILVMYEGGISGELSKDEISEESIMRYAVGMKGGNEN